MSIVVERPTAPAVPEEPIGDQAFMNMLHGNDDRDEIVYPHPQGTFSTTRAEREKATKAWHDEGHVAHPDNAEASLRRTEDMLRLRLKMGPRERGQAVTDLVRLHSDHLPKLQLDYTPPTPETPRFDHPTGDFRPKQEFAAKDQAAQNETPHPASQPETRRKFGRNLRVPLRNLVRHGLRRTRAHQ